MGRQLLVAGEVRDTEAAAEIDCVQWPFDRSGDAQSDLDSFAILADENFMIQDSCPRKQVNAAEFQRGIAQDFPDHVTQIFFVNAERRRFASHAHCATLRFRAWIDANCETGSTADLARDGADPLQFQQRLDVNLANVPNQDELQIRFRFARPGKKYSARGATRLERELTLAS